MLNFVWKTLHADSPTIPEVKNILNSSLMSQVSTDFTSFPCTVYLLQISTYARFMIKREIQLKWKHFLLNTFLRINDKTPFPSHFCMSMINCCFHSVFRDKTATPTWKLRISFRQQYCEFEIFAAKQFECEFQQFSAISKESKRTFSGVIWYRNEIFMEERVRCRGTTQAKNWKESS